MSNIERHILWPDTHCKYEDKKAVSLMHRIIDVVQPDEIDIMGDFMDCYSVSQHDKDPSRRDTFDDELEYGNQELDKIQKHRTRVTYLFGNHENRVDRFLMQRAPELYSIVKLSKLLRLQERGWKVVPYGQDTRVGHVYLTHDVGHAGATAHTRSRAAYEANVVIGHTHRCAWEVVGNHRGKPRLGAMVGWLGDVRKIDYMHRAKAAAWSLGFGILDNDKTHNIQSVQVIPIVNYGAFVDGKRISL
jgi:predicted phosphodiesterase